MVIYFRHILPPSKKLFNDISRGAELQDAGATGGSSQLDYSALRPARRLLLRPLFFCGLTAASSDDSLICGGLSPA
jgi:hypothetical protein